jgi:AcrR family transcriptional regulator
LRKICAEAGLTQGAFYSNFASKQELLLEVMERHLEEQHRQLAELAVMLRDAEADQTFAVFMAWLQSAGEKREWATLAIELRLHAERDPAFGALMRLADARTVVGFAGLLDELMHRLSLKSRLPVDALAEALLSLWYASVLRRSGQGRPETIVVEVLREMLVER